MNKKREGKYLPFYYGTRKNLPRIKHSMLRKRFGIPPGLCDEASYWWRLYFHEVIDKDSFEPGGIIALRELCNLLVEENMYIKAVFITGPLSADAARLELIRCRIADFCNYLGLGKFLLAASIPTIRELLIRNKLGLYDKSILRMENKFGKRNRGKSKEEEKEEEVKVKEVDKWS